MGRNKVIPEGCLWLLAFRLARGSIPGLSNHSEEGAVILKVEVRYLCRIDDNRKASLAR